MMSGEEHSHAGTARFRRAPDVVWRVTSDRVLVHRVGACAAGDDDADLIGNAALVWAAADEAVTALELSVSTGLETAEVISALADLVDTRWVIAT